MGRKSVYWNSKEGKARDTAIYELKQSGMSHEAIGEIYGLSASRIKQICQVQSWQVRRLERTLVPMGARPVQPVVPAKPHPRWSDPTYWERVALLAKRE
jgi:hypothetical protein